MLREENFFAVPTHFLDTTVIEKRKPLVSNARRQGWVGCYIVMDRISEAGKVFYVKNGQALKKSAVIEAWGRTTFLRQSSFEARGWALEILRNIQSLNAREFTIDTMYGFEAELKQRFPRNKFIRPQIRKQLQVLRDAGLIVFRGRGHYSLAPDPSVETPQERGTPSLT